MGFERFGVEAVSGFKMLGIMKVLPLSLLACILGLLLQSSCLQVGKMFSCKIKGQTADCRHLSLKEVPSDLPANITRLDISHNMLQALPWRSLVRYPMLVRLDASFNDIKHLESEMCHVLPLLMDLILHRNEVHLLTKEELLHCSHLMHLDLSANRLKLQREPFQPLQNLTTLDVSANGLTSAQLGSSPQLWKLETLSLSDNSIMSIESRDLAFLNCSSIQTLFLSSLPLKTVSTKGA
ncbi:hypothetical protein GJAV_G00060820 [Gymnothorax javanicus]|nr:hypothetical protein GJAV_G00060820 [Gymnothorax javanicus]